MYQSALPTGFIGTSRRLADYARAKRAAFDRSCASRAVVLLAGRVSLCHPTNQPHPELARVSAHVEGRTALLPVLRPTPCEVPERFEIAANERFLLGAAPA